MQPRRKVRTLSTIKKLNEYGLQTELIMTSIILAVISRTLVELDLDYDGMPSLVSELSFVLWLGSIMGSGAVMINKHIQTIKLKKEIDEFMRTEHPELVHANPNLQQSVVPKAAIPISRAATARQYRGNKPTKKTNSWPSLADVMSGFSNFTKSLFSREVKPLEILSQTSVLAENFDTELKPNPQNKGKKKHATSTAARAKQPARKENIVNRVTTDIPPIYTTWKNIYDCLAPPSQRSVNKQNVFFAREQIATAVVQSVSNDFSSMTAVTEKCTVAPDAQHAKNYTTETTLSSENKVDENPEQELEIMKNQIAALLEQLNASKEELKNQAMLMQEQTATLSSQLLETKNQADKLKEVSNYSESKNEKSSANQEVDLILQDIQITMSDVNETSSNPASYMRGTFNQGDMLALQLTRLLATLPKADPASSAASAMSAARAFRHR